MIQTTKEFQWLWFNRRVDVLVGEYVFNYNIKIQAHEAIYAEHTDIYESCTWLPEKGPAVIVPCYSTLLTSAWDIVKKFDYFYLFRKKDWKDGDWECKLIPDETREVLGKNAQAYAWAETEQLAICYAGLKAVGFDLETFLIAEERA